MSKDIVVPGEMLSADMNKQLGAHTFAQDNKVYSDVLGLRNESDTRISVVPLRGRYVPQENDVVIGVVKNEKFAGYDVEINGFYSSFVNKQELREPLKVGSVVSAKIVKVNELNEADLGMVRPLHEGEVVSVTPVKVPRVIGKNASMLNAIKNGTGSTVMVGRNGLVWVHGGNAQLAVETIQRIEEYSHIENLTSDIQKFLAAKTGMGAPGTHGPTNESAFESGFEGGQGGFGRDRGGFRGRGGPRGAGGFGGGGRDRGGFRGPPRDGGNRGFNRGPRMGGGFGNRDRPSFGGDRGPRMNSFGGPPRDRGFSPRPREDFGNNPPFRENNSFQPSNRDFTQDRGPRMDRRGDRPMDDRGFRPNRRFGEQFEREERPAFEPRPRPNFDAPRDDRRKRFPRDNTRIRGDEDPSFE